MTTNDIWNTAVTGFWTGRNLQTQRQAESGTLDAGLRGAVTAGKHLDALAQAVAQLFQGDPDLRLDVRFGAKLSLPGYYRCTKDWDLVVLHRGALVAAIELKSQVGPSFGNNFNNRSEEAIGNAVDIWKAYESGYLGQVRPWLGFVMIVESVPASTSVKRDPKALFPTDPVFHATSYMARYRILLQRLVREKHYDAAVVAAAEPGGGVVDEPVFDLSFANLQAAAAARVAYIKALPDEAFVGAPLV